MTVDNPDLLAAATVEPVVLVVAGDFDTKATLAKIEREYSSWKKGYTAPAVPKEPAQTAQPGAWTGDRL